MLLMMPIIAQTSFSLGIYGSVFIKMIIETMEGEDWDEPKKNSMALFCMTALGVGAIVGSFIFGRVQDSCGMTVTIYVCLVIAVIACSMCIIYAIHFTFNIYLCIAMTFTWGMQDATGILLMHCLCGFEFDSKTTPFSV